MADVIPANLDLSTLTVEQLNLLQQEIEKQKATAKEQARQTLRETIIQALEGAGLTVADLPSLFPRSARGPAASKSRPAYRHPEKPRVTWTGKGRKPAWITEYLAVDGNRLEDLKVR